MKSYPLGYAAAAVGVLAIGLAATFRLPPTDEVQRGYRGTGMVENFDPHTIAAQLAASKLPSTLPPRHAGLPASQAYKNVQVLGSLDVATFTRLMVSMTKWVAPKQGCSYCHNTHNMSSDALYTKVVARRMLQMVRHINSGWTQHVQNVGVTCFTCHRGNPVPSNIYYENVGQLTDTDMVEANTGKNLATVVAGDSSLPYDAVPYFLDQHNNIRVESSQALPGADMTSIKQTEWTYALMIHFSQSLGVNCTYCHNTQQFANWSQSTPQRVTAWYGIRMVRDLNNNYLDPLKPVFPSYRLGPSGDNPKLACATCHQGVYKPLFGVSPVVGFPELVSDPGIAAK